MSVDLAPIAAPADSDHDDICHTVLDCCGRLTFCGADPGPGEHHEYGLDCGRIHCAVCQDLEDGPCPDCGAA